MMRRIAEFSQKITNILKFNIINDFKIFEPHACHYSDALKNITQKIPHSRRQPAAKWAKNRTFRLPSFSGN